MIIRYNLQPTEINQIDAYVPTLEKNEQKELCNTEEEGETKDKLIKKDVNFFIKIQEKFNSFDDTYFDGFLIELLHKSMFESLSYEELIQILEPLAEEANELEDYEDNELDIRKEDNVNFISNRIGPRMISIVRATARSSFSLRERNFQFNIKNEILNMDSLEILDDEDDFI